MMKRRTTYLETAVGQKISHPCRYNAQVESSFALKKTRMANEVAISENKLQETNESKKKTKMKLEWQKK